MEFATFCHSKRYCLFFVIRHIYHPSFYFFFRLILETTDPLFEVFCSIPCFCSSIFAYAVYLLFLAILARSSLFTFFPEIEYDKVDKVRGMDIIFVTTAKTDEEARELLTLFNMPFQK